MDLADVQNPRHEGFSFGVEPQKIAEGLRKMADDIDSRRIVPQQVRLVQRATLEDFYLQSLIIRFAERISQPTTLPPIDG